MVFSSIFCPMCCDFVTDYAFLWSSFRGSSLSWFSSRIFVPVSALGVLFIVYLGYWFFLFRNFLFGLVPDSFHSLWEFVFLNFLFIYQ